MQTPHLLVYFFLLCFGAISYGSLNEEIHELTSRAEQNLSASLETNSISQALAYKALYGRWSTRANSLAHKLSCENALSIARFLSGESAPLSLKLNATERSQITELTRHFPTRAKKALWSQKASLKSYAEKDASFDLSQVLIDLREDLSLEEKEDIYCALDLMALQIETLAGPDATIGELIDHLSQYIFFDLKLRFPPQKTYSPEIDRYTDIVAVASSRRGVCLGVSALYLCLAERLGIYLEIVTPPGHIYLRYNGRNIETTARGLDLPDEAYVSIQTKKLQTRAVKEVPGLVLVNNASTLLHQKDYAKALETYEKASLFLPDDPLVLELKGVSSLLVGKAQNARTFLKAALNTQSDFAFCSSSYARDILDERCDASAIEALLVSDENESPSDCAQRLEKAFSAYPDFAAGQQALASAYLAEGATLKAKLALEKCLTLSPKDPSIPYHLAYLALDEYAFDQAFSYLEKAEAIVENEKAPSKALWNLKMELFKRAPKGSLMGKRL